MALFSLPFEARPADPVRLEVFRQQAIAGSASWFPPSAVPSGAPLALTPARQSSAGTLPPFKWHCRKGIKTPYVY